MIARIASIAALLIIILVIGYIIGGWQLPAIVIVCILGGIAVTVIENKIKEQ